MMRSRGRRETGSTRLHRHRHLSTHLRHPDLISEARQSMAFVAGLDGIHGVAVGTLSEQEIDANVAFFEHEVMEEAWEGMESRRRRLLIMEQFCKGCGTCIEICGSEAVVDEAGGLRAVRLLRFRVPRIHSSGLV